MNIDLKFVGPKSKVKLLDSLKESFYLERELQVHCYDEACVFPQEKGIMEGGVVDSKGYIVNNSRMTEIENNRQKCDIHESSYENKNAIFIGMFMFCFGHVITDDLKKLWFLQSEEGKRLIESGAELVYLSRFGVELKPYLYHILELAGIDRTKAKLISRATKYKRIYVPENSMIRKKIGNMDKLFYTNEFIRTVNLVKSKIPIGKVSYEKIYLSRTALRDPRDHGEKNVEKLFASKGYLVIRPERIPFEQQVQLYSSCKEIVTTEGSISHALMFCNSNTKIVILRKGNYINEYQMMINDMARLNVIYLDANHTLNDNVSWDGPFYMYPTTFICKYLDIHEHFFYIFDFDFYKYLYLELRKRLKKKVRTIICRFFFIDTEKSLNYILKNKMLWYS